MLRPLWKTPLSTPSSGLGKRDGREEEREEVEESDFVAKKDKIRIYLLLSHPKETIEEILKIEVA